jgi:hypothetical protein
MTTKLLGKIGRSVLLISPIVIAVVGFFALLLWLKPRNATLVLLLTGVFSLFVIGYSNYLGRRAGRRMDEVQIASMGFASFRGYVWGAGTTVLLLLLPSLRNSLIDLADLMTARAPDMITRHRAAMLMALYFGFLLLLLMQMVCMIVASVIWQRRMGGMPEQS